MCGLPFTKPRQIVACVCADLFRLRDEWFPEKQPPASVTMFQETIEELMEPSRITVDDMMKAKQGSSSTKGFKDPPVVEDSQTSSNKTEEIIQETDREEQIDIGSHCQDAELLLVVKAAESTPPVEKTPTAHIQKSVDEATGGLMAFSSKKSRTSEPTKTVVEQIQVDSAPEHPEEEVEEHKSIQQESHPEQPKIVGRLETKKVVIWYQKDNRYDEVMCEEKTTIAELIQAEKTIQKTEFLEAFSAVGQPYTNNMMLKELPIVVLMEGTPVTSHNLSQHAFDLRAWNRADASLIQQGAVAIDEMNFYLHTLQKNIQTPCEVVDAVWFQSLADTTAIANEWIEKFSTTGMTISAILHVEHWIPIIACASSDQHFAVFTTPEGKHLWPLLFPMEDQIGVFTQQNGQAVPHLNIEQVSPNVKGIVVATESEYQPYASQKQISQEGLAFLVVLAPYSEELAALGEEIHFPAQSVATSEPVLLSAVMIQKGQQSVQRCLPKNQVQVAQIPTQTVKFLVYRDQFPQQWQELVDRPVKQILELIPEMRVCKNTECRFSKVNMGGRTSAMGNDQERAHQALRIMCPAKPLQPAGKSADGSGLKWHVQASEAPENFVYTLSHGDVPDNREVVRQVPMHRVEASEHTMKRSLGQQPLHWDPWQEAAQQLQSSSSNKPQQISTAQIATIETNLEAKLMQKIKTQEVDANMEPSMEPRVAKLEQQLQQLQVQQMDTAKTTQQLSNKVDQFATQMDGHSRQIQGHLDQKLAEQMDRIEALLAKRQRQE
eukprot:symbB.v1.2.006696.t1/scaffold404.1/size210989/2